MSSTSPARLARSRCGQRQGQVGEGDVGQGLADPVQAVGLLEARLAQRGQGVQDHGPGLVVVAGPGELAGQVVGRLVERRRVGQEPDATRAAARREAAWAEVIRSLGRLAGRLGPGATQGQPPSSFWSVTSSATSP